MQDREQSYLSFLTHRFIELLVDRIVAKLSQTIDDLYEQSEQQTWMFTSFSIILEIAECLVALVQLISMFTSR